MSSVLYNLAELGKQQFGEDIFRRSFSDNTLRMVVWLQEPDQYTQELHKTYMTKEPEFSPCEFVDYHNAMCAYARDPSEENSRFVAGHSYRRRFYPQGNLSTQQSAIDYGTQIMTNFGSVGSYWAD